MCVLERASKLRNTSTLILAAAFLSACLTGEEVEDSGEALGAESELSGSVGDGPISGASMRVLTADGEILSEFQSDSVGAYRIMVLANDSDYPLIVDAWNGIDLVTNLPPDFALRGAAVEFKSKLVANVNPFSTLAIEAALDLNGGLTANNIETAQDIVTSAFNGGLSTLLAAGPMYAPIGSGNIAEIVRASESLAEVVRRTRNWKNAFGFSTNADQVVESLGSDLIDEVIDGAGGSRSDARAAAVSTVVTAQVLLEAMSNELHVNGIDATSSMEAAIDQVSAAPANPQLGDLVVTAGMIEQVKTGLSAAAVVSQDNALTQLRVAVSGIQPGFGPALVKSVLPANYRQTLENILPMVAGANNSTLAAINEVARTGGTDPQTNRAPTISGTPASQVVAGAAYQFAPTAADADGDTLTFSITGKPAWLNFNSSTGALTGTPNTSNAGSFSNIVIRVTDGEATASLPAFSITVTVPNVNSPPAISGTPSTAAVVGSAYSFTPTASDADGDPLTFSITGRPAWATFNTQTGRLNGTPSSTGTFNNIVIRASDGQATSSLPAFSIVVTATAPANRAPTISGTPATSINAGQAYSFTPSASDPDGDNLTFSITGRPAWMTFSSSNGRLSGTPSASNAGTFSNIVIRVSDGQASSSLAAFSITVNVSNSPPTISGTPATSVNANSPYSFTPTASDPDGNALSFSVSGLPSWASFNSSNGRISGTPGDQHVGTHSGIQITVSDGTATASLGPFSITVQQVSLGSVTLNWTPPTQNEDGTPLTDLAGYRFMWGPSAGNYPNSVVVNNPGITSYVIDNLAPGTYVFAAKAVNSAGVESQFSNTASKTIP